MLSSFVGASTSGNSVYWIGRVGGRPMIYRILKMRFLQFLINERSLDRAERYFDAHGGKTVFVGVTRTRYYRFLPYNLAAGVVWAVAYSLVGYVFGQYWDELLAVARSLGYGVLALVALALLVYFLRLRRSRKR
jgi:membrane protein DedA with SNARE-associated domain